MLLLRPILDAFLSRSREVNEYNVIDFGALIMILYSVVGFVIALFSMSRNRRFVRRITFETPLIWLFLFIILCFCSMAWSSNIAITGFRSFECLSCMMIITATIVELLDRTSDIDEVIRWSIFYIGFLLVVRFCWCLTWWILPKNLLGAGQASAPIFFYLAIYNGEKNTLAKWLIIFFTLVCLSTTSYLGLFLGLISLFFLNKKNKAPLVFAIITVVLVLMVVGFKDVLASTIFSNRSGIVEAKNLEEVMKYSSGRDAIWDIASTEALKRPFGMGFCVGDQEIVRNIFGKGVINAHNSLINAMLNVGFIGLFLMLLLFVSYFFMFTKEKMTKKYQAAMIGCYCVVFLACMGNPSIGGRVYGSWIYTVYIMVLISSIYIWNKYYKVERIKN